MLENWNVGLVKVLGTVRAESTPLHRGKRTQVWQTRITDPSGRMLSLTIQTQVIL